MMLAVRDRDLGEQIAAESFTRLFERWASFETENHALRFAYRTALNLATSHHRHERRWGLLRSSRGRELTPGTAAGPEEATATRAAGGRRPRAMPSSAPLRERARRRRSG